MHQRKGDMGFRVGAAPELESQSLKNIVNSNSCVLAVCDAK